MQRLEVSGSGSIRLATDAIKSADGARQGIYLLQTPRLKSRIATTTTLVISPASTTISVQMPALYQVYTSYTEDSVTTPSVRYFYPQWSINISHIPTVASSNNNQLIHRFSFGWLVWGLF